MDLNKMDIKDLKALAYDLATSSSKIQQDLNVVNQAIFQKQNQKVTEIKDDVKIDIKEKKK